VRSSTAQAAETSIQRYVVPHRYRHGKRVVRLRPVTPVYTAVPEPRNQVVDFRHVRTRREQDVIRRLITEALDALRAFLPEHQKDRFIDFHQTVRSYCSLVLGRKYNDGAIRAYLRRTIREQRVHEPNREWSEAWMRRILQRAIRGIADEVMNKVYAGGEFRRPGRNNSLETVMGVTFNMWRHGRPNVRAVITIDGPGARYLQIVGKASHDPIRITYMNKNRESEAPSP
jgi:hypothetical protein